MKNKMNDHLEQILDLPANIDYVQVEGHVNNHMEAITTSSELIAEEETDLTDDYEFSRKNIRDLIELTTGTLEELTELARQSQSPRTYEVLSDLAKTLTQSNKELLDIHAKIQQIKQKNISDNNFKKSKRGEGTVNQAIFVGSSADLLELLKTGEKKK